MSAIVQETKNTSKSAILKAHQFPLVPLLIALVDGLVVAAGVEAVGLAAVEREGGVEGQADVDGAAGTKEEGLVGLEEEHSF